MESAVTQFAVMPILPKSAKRDNLVPIGLIEGAIVQKPIKVGDLITYEQVQVDESLMIVQLRRMQDTLGLTIRLVERRY